MAKKIMIQGTMSNSGKSFVAAALCRIFKQDGYSVAPFKSQNMALNSYITKDGLEIGRAQAMQAEAAGIAPTVDMNPILLKPTSQMGSQVIVNGEVFGNLRAMDYYRRKTEFIPAVREAFERLESQFDAIVLEGAGSPAEINLRDNDIVNMGMAKIANAPVLLVGDIDRGGVFASLYGTVSLLEPEERARIKGLVINKFRGDVKILEPGLRMIEERLHIPVVGVIPMEQIDLDDEDSLSDRLVRTKAQDGLDVAVIHLPHISNFTDFNALEHYEGVSLRYVDRAAHLGRPDLILLPGTKNTLEDLKWLRECGLEAAICRLHGEGVPVFGICGGYQMMGEQVSDPDGVEAGGTLRGMGLLPVSTVFSEEKTRTRMRGRVLHLPEVLSGHTEDGAAAEALPEVSGYEIHMGTSVLAEGAAPFLRLSDGREDGCVSAGAFPDADQGTGIRPAGRSASTVGGYGSHLYDTGKGDRRMSEIIKKPDPVRPEDIEKRSMEIICQELGERTFPEPEFSVIRRCIHTSADFDYADNLCFSPGAVETGIRALQNGAHIVTDTTMAMAGINKRKLAEYGGSVHCFIQDADVAREAKARGITRSAVSMERAAALPGPLIFAIGNAPTALIRLYDLIRENGFSPALIIGVPVGFVHVVEAKELIMQTEVPYIVARGRKGGSNIAAAICNAMLYAPKKENV